MEWTDTLLITFIIGSVLLGGTAGFLIQIFVFEKNPQSKERLTLDRIEKEKRILRSKQKEIENLIRNDSRRARSNWDKEKKKNKSELLAQLNKIQAQEKEINRKSRFYDSQIRELESHLRQTQETIQKTKAESEQLSDKIEKNKASAPEYANLSQEQAKQILLERIQPSLKSESGNAIYNKFMAAKNRIKEEKLKWLTQNITQQAQALAQERTVLTVHLPDDKMKGSIIGREGRNIRALEAATGMNVLIDESPATILISGFDHFKKRVAQVTIEKLLAEGKITPQRIEEVQAESEQTVLKELRETGIKTVKEAGVQGLHPELLPMLGKLKYHFTGQINLLEHSIESARLAEELAKDLGINPQLCKKAALLHDIGRTMDKEVPGPHTELSAGLLKKYGEQQPLIQAVREHLNWEDATQLPSLIVALAVETTLLRPGVPTESAKNYLLRLSEIEKTIQDREEIKNCAAYLCGSQTRIWAQSHPVTEGDAGLIVRELCHQFKENAALNGNVTVVLSAPSGNYFYQL